MDFLEVIEQAREVLRSKGRVTYRTLKRQFALDEETLEDLKNELIEAELYRLKGTLTLEARGWRLVPPLPKPQASSL